MEDNAKKFERFRQEHARLHDPTLVRGAVELVPTSWNDAISDCSKRNKTGKKKFWRELKRVTEESTFDTLLPIEFIECLRMHGNQTQERTYKKSHVDARSTEATSSQSISIEPRSVTCNLSPFQELAFSLDAPGANRVELVWLADAAIRPQRVVMDHKQGDRFETQVGLPDGHYLFAYAVDGYLRPDPRLAHNIVLNQQGLFAPLTLAKQEQVFVVTNRGTRNESLLLETGAEWLSPETATIEVRAGETARVSVRFEMALMTPGLNEALLRFSVRRGDEMVPTGAVHIAAHLEVGGAVPDFVFEPGDFGEVMQGMGVVQLRVDLTARGRGPLTGMISLPHSGELADFKLNADDVETSQLSHTFQIDSSNLPQPQPHRADAVLKVIILSDSFLANYRLRQFDIPYRLIYLRKSLSALSFGTVRVGGTKNLRVEVMRSDARETELTVDLPPGAENYLEVYTARDGTYIFRFDAAGLSPGSSINETVEFVDHRSGLRSQIKLLGAVALPIDEPTEAVTH